MARRKRRRKDDPPWADIESGARVGVPGSEGERDAARRARRAAAAPDESDAPPPQDDAPKTPEEAASRTAAAAQEPGPGPPPPSEPPRPALSWEDPRGRRGPPLTINPRSLRKFILGVLIFIVLLAVPRPEGLTWTGQAAIALFVFIVYLWITEALPLPVAALIAGVGLVGLGIKESSSDAFMLYAQDTFFFILGSLIIADGVTKSGADRHIATAITSRFGGNTWSLLAAFVVTCSLLAMFITEHAVAAVMIPIGLTILRATNARDIPRYSAALIIGIAFACNIAGLATPSGGARNAIALGYMKEIYGVNVSYLEWMKHGVPVTLTLIPVVFFGIVGMFRIPIRPLKGVERTTEPWSGNQKAALGILGFTVVLWILVGENYGLGLIAVIGVVLMFLAGVLDWEDTRKTIPWGVAFVYGAALAMGQVLSETGAAGYLAGEVLQLIPPEQTAAILIGIVVLVVLMTNFMSDGATVAVIAPITLSLAALVIGVGAAGSDLIPTVGIATAASSAFAFVLVIGTPPNLIAYATGAFTPKQFAQAGILITLVSMGVLILAVLFYWPLL